MSFETSGFPGGGAAATIWHKRRITKVTAARRMSRVCAATYHKSESDTRRE